MKFVKVSILVAVALSLALGAAIAADVDTGKSLFNDPQFGQSKNDKTCNTCHPDGRGLEKSAAKESFTIMGQEKATLADAVNLCIEMALQGTAIDTDSEEMTNVVEYIKSLEGKEPPKKKRKIEGC